MRTGCASISWRVSCGTSENLEKIKTSYLGQSSKQREEIELNTLEALHQKQLLSEEEYQRARMAIKAQYADGKTPGKSTGRWGKRAEGGKV